MSLLSVPNTEQLLENVKTAFTILNTDNLNVYGKPNAIVKPVRRREPSDDVDFLKDVDSQVIHPDPMGSDNELKHFGKELDFKLRQLQKNSSPKKGNSNENLHKKPLFVTTVPTGIYLPPATQQLPNVPRRVYTYCSIPHVLPSIKQQEYRQHHASDTNPITDQHFYYKTYHTREAPPPQNIMFDRRVVRGSNYVQPWNPHFAYAGLLSGKPPDARSDWCNREAEAKRRQLIRKQIINTRNPRNIIGTPPPIKGRKHEDVQTDQYLEELFIRPPEYDAECQTELFLHRPPTPPYVPAKIGVDVSTEILDGELFDFDTEVMPLVETLVGRSVEQGIIEVMHEEEVAELKKQQQQLLALREVELAELRRLEAEEDRLEAEKIRRTQEDEMAQKIEHEMEERVTAARLLQGHIAELLPDILNSMEPYMQAKNREHLEQSIGPWLTKEVSEEIGQMVDSRDLLEEIVREILHARSMNYIEMAERELAGPQIPLDEGVEEEETILELEDEQSNQKEN